MVEPDEIDNSFEYLSTSELFKHSVCSRLYRKYKRNQTRNEVYGIFFGWSMILEYKNIKREIYGIAAFDAIIVSKKIVERVPLC